MPALWNEGAAHGYSVAIQPSCSEVKISEPGFFLTIHLALSV